MHTLTYTLFLISDDKGISASKSETFETLKEAEERANALEGIHLRKIGDFCIDGKRFMTNHEKNFWDQLDLLGEGKPNNFYALLN